MFKWLLLALLCLCGPGMAANLYLRFQLLSPVKAGVYADVLAYTHGQDDKFFVGLRPLPPSGANYPAKWIKEGQYSPWTATGEKTLHPRENTLIFTFRSREEVKNIDVLIEIASEADPATVLTNIKGTTDGDVFSFLLPAEPAKDQKLLTVADRTREHLERARAAFPGEPPQLRHLTIDTGVGGFAPSGKTGGGRSPVYRSEQIFRDELETLRRYGFNTLAGNPALFEPYAREAGFTFISNDCQPPIDQVWQPDYADKVAGIAKKWNEEYAQSPELKKRVFNLRLADEPGLVGSDWADNAQANAAFRAYLQQRGFTPADFGLNDWAEARLVLSREQIGEIERLWSDRQAKAAPLLYYHSKKFQSYSSWLAFKIATDEYRKSIDPGMLTSINPSPHPMYGRGLLSSNSLDWMEGGRMGAVTMPWTEDWLGVSGWVAINLQHVGFLADMLRAGARYHDAPIGMYLIPVGCNSYLATTQKTFSALGRGVTHLNYFLYGPYYAATWDFYSENYEDLRAIGDATRKVAVVEQDLVQAKYKRPQVAILWPTSAEVWQESNIYNTERQLLWLLLDRQQIPVDFLEEEDLEAGLLDGYKVVFALGDCLTKKAGTKLVEWVNGGGQLWLSPGSGLYDEYRRENTILGGLTGFRANALWIDKSFSGWGNCLNNPQPLATVQPKDAAVPALPALFARQHFTPAGEVRATFNDGKPALARNTVGKGQVWQAGFMLGLAYAAGCNKKENEGFATVFPEVYGKLLDPVLAAGNVKKPVIVDKPGIQTSLLESPAKKVIVLTDFTRDPKTQGANEVMLTVLGAGKAKKVTSAAGVKLTVVKKGADLQITVPLNIGDILVIEN
ncbi:MAG: hypothetical protein ACYC6A_17425 [Armatimonadota bacterium]